jgi:hypothetical protein
MNGSANRSIFPEIPPKAPASREKIPYLSAYGYMKFGADCDST